MDAKEEVEICSNCNKEVVKTNLPMHEAHCQRFLCLCPDCKEQVPKDLLEEHRQEQHTLIKCKQCNMKMEKFNLPDHESYECTKRMQSCEYCQLSLPLNILEEHVVTCGSRTERCEHCNQYVILKDQLQHAQICINEDLQTKSIHGYVKPVNSQQDIERYEYVRNSSKDQTDSEPKDTILSLSDLLKKKKKQNDNLGFKIDPDQISTCPYCHLALPVNTLRWHEEKCRIMEGLRRMSEATDTSGKK
ncbi:XIAP-associated factor 1 isoform X2 [Tachysurus fulvidraco]|uniref:XIAP-associated factor 1 isoform X2 n=1 Tax=Tachysurus fulvidraco TaxID=1234273 RepID=UPI001FF0151B|nr:XIAP-associated factor 1 isoform X2 [Tachysurus fulvidraco]XP_027006596.2 XIAP-associated factor 1 isoform X2 [Tachysurus fulvidraco]